MPMFFVWNINITLHGKFRLIQNNFLKRKNLKLNMVLILFCKMSMLGRLLGSLDEYFTKIMWKFIMYILEVLS